MSREDQHRELQCKTRQRLNGSLKRVQVATLAAALVPLASVAVSHAAASAQRSGGTSCALARGGDSFGLNSAAAHTVLGKRVQTSTLKKSAGRRGRPSEFSGTPSTSSSSPVRTQVPGRVREGCWRSCRGRPHDRGWPGLLGSACSPS